MAIKKKCIKNVKERLKTHSFDQTIYLKNKFSSEIYALNLFFYGKECLKTNKDNNRCKVSISLSSIKFPFLNLNIFCRELLFMLMCEKEKYFRMWKKILLSYRNSEEIFFVLITL